MVPTLVLGTRAKNFYELINLKCVLHTKVSWVLTPELSRAERGGCEPVLPACLEVSTKPRNGVGLNDLLGGWDADEVEALAGLPKAEAGEYERAPQTFSWTCQK